MLKFLLFFWFVVLSLSFSCKQSKKESDIEKAISGLIKRFPQLPYGKEKYTDYYKLVREVTIGRKNIKLQLRSSPDTLDDVQKIILISNENNDIYAIPFFSNLYRDYWNFLFDTVIPSVKPTKATFQSELNSSLDKLGLNDTIGTGGIVINELLISLLQCERIRREDSVFIKVGALVSYDDIEPENSDSCDIRLNKNWESISKVYNSDDYKNQAFTFSVYWDKKNNRIYKFDFEDFYPRRKTDFTIQSYRQDCIYQFISI